ncbi:MAG: arsenite S-adenosylmethyltransferase [Bacteroidetes bacterium B1(2017)]|nr:MAG: arsenite S-adenosylmethyltransferase [Bacteroidetes bacterium B1(2017)]
MKTEVELKELVKEKYAQIALQDKDTNMSSCCGSGTCSTEVYTIMSEDYTQMEGYAPSADLGLGCGLPTEFALFKEGQTVVDLGSGAGNDCFIARKFVGENGKVIGVDFTPEMIERARLNADTLGYNNVEFRLGDIENMPIAANRADVIVSNCVLNLVPNKENVIQDIFRVLKPGGHYSISDVVLVGELPIQLKETAEMYAGCVSGAIQKSEYLNLIKEAGFINSTIQKEKEIIIPTDILETYLNKEQLEEYKASSLGIYSITVYAEKPAACCEPGGNCC